MVDFSPLERFTWPLRPFGGRGCVVALVLCGLVVGTHATRADESQTRYFEQLRRRGLFSLAEGYALARLAESPTPLARRTELVIELSRTLAEHAEFASHEQQAELWKRAASVIHEERTREPSNPRDVMLAAQVAIATAAEGGWLTVECELRPFDEPLIARCRTACSTAITLLKEVEQQLAGPGKDRTLAKGLADGGPSSHELRGELQRVRFQLALCLKNRAELSSADARKVSVDLLDAEQVLRKLIGVADEPISTQSKLRLASCSRLKGDWERADTLLQALEKSEPRLTDALLEEWVAERARLMLARQRGADAAELIVRTRAKQKRLTGELWYLQVRALASMRDAALQKKDDKLAEQLREQAEITLERSDEQAGGFWSRRSRQAWESVRTAEKYGPALDAAMQQARADFLGGRIDAALKGYATAEQAARVAGQTEMAIDLAYTRASILLNERQFEPAAADFLRLAREFPEHARAAPSHLNAAYCLGRLYDAKKTQTNREAYTAALDRHVELFANDPSVNDARFLKGQLEESRLQATAALPLYLQVGDESPRAEEAHAGAARCYEVILLRMRERKLDTTELEREAVKTLSRHVEAFSETATEWSVPQAEVALHLSSLLMLSEPPRFDQAEPWLGKVLAQTGRVAEAERNDTLAVKDERWQRLRVRATALSVIALAGSGRPLEAERMVQSLVAASPQDLLAIVERLAPFVASTDREQRLRFVELQLRAASRLNEQRAALTKPEQESLDQALGRAYLASGQLAKGVELYSRLASETPKDAARQRDIAQQLDPFDDRPCQSLARQCWRRIEVSTKPGSPDWLLARIGLITTSSKLGEQLLARKLLETTKALHPTLGGPALQPQFESLDRQLNSPAQE